MRVLPRRVFVAVLAAWLVLVGLPTARPADAQGVVSTVGREFFVAFSQAALADIPAWPFDSERLFFHISSDVAASGTIDFVNASFSDIPFSVTAGAMTTIELPREVGKPHPASAPDGVSDYGIRISADADVSVHAVWYVEGQVDGFVVPPTNAGGQQFIIPTYVSTAYTASIDNHRSGFIVVAHADNTTVRYIPRVNPQFAYDMAAAEELYLSGPPDLTIVETVTLDRGESFVYQVGGEVVASVATEREPSGTIVETDKPVSVYSFSICSDIPYLIAYCDYLAESVPPVSSWGSDYLVPPSPGRLASDTFRAFAWLDDTVITLNGTELATLAAGEFFEYRQRTNEALQFSGSQPFQLMRYFNGEDWDTVKSDPSMLTAIPVDAGLRTVRLSTPDISGQTFTHTLSIVKPSDASVTLNGVALDSGWTNFAGTDYDWLLVDNIAVGAHELVGSRRIQVSLSGAKYLASYAYPAGYNLAARWQPPSLLFPAEEELPPVPTAAPTCSTPPTLTAAPEQISPAADGRATIEVNLRNQCSDSVFSGADLLVSLSDGLSVQDGSAGLVNLGQRAAWQNLALAAGETRSFQLTIAAAEPLPTAPQYVAEVYHRGAAVTRVDSVPSAALPAAAEPAATVPAEVAAPAEAAAPVALPATLPNTGAVPLPLLWLPALAAALAAAGAALRPRR
jgi:hypothetical protein